jgi:hypothetical protein
MEGYGRRVPHAVPHLPMKTSASRQALQKKGFAELALNRPEHAA